MRDDTRMSFYVGEGRDGRFYPIVSTCTPLRPETDGYKIGPGYETEEQAAEEARRWEAHAIDILGGRLTKLVRYQW